MTRDWGPPRRASIRSLDDIERIEAQPYESAVPLQSTYDVFLRSEALFGDRTALTFLPNGNPDTVPQRYTYRELRRRVTAAANLFRASGVGPDDAVALLMPPVPEGHFALWGAEVAGRACPINNLLSVEHIASIIEAAGAKALVFLGPTPGFDIADKVAQIRTRAKGLEAVFQAGGSPGATASASDFMSRLQIAREGSLDFTRTLGPGDTAACFHTGGTTGAPKLARHTHGNEIHTSWFGGLYYDLAPDDVVMCGLPIFHVAGAFVYGAATFIAGANLVLPTAMGMRNTELVANLWRFIARDRVTQIAAVPTVLAMMLSQKPGDLDISSLRAAYAGGSPLPTELAAQFERDLKVPVRNIYGMTESAGLIGIIPLAAERKPNSCGWRLPYTQVLAVPMGPGGEPLLDAPCKPEQSGVIVIRGPHVSPGYTDESRNAGMFAADGWLVSGDLGHIDASGQIHVTGRAKDVIIRGAHNIDPTAIEEAVLKHPAVQTCAAVGEPDAHAGELPVVFVALRPGATATAEEILAAARPHIAEPPAVPKRCTIIEAMPQTAVGKIYKPALRTIAIERAYTEALARAGIRAVATAAETPRGHIVRIAGATAETERIRAAVGHLPVPFEIDGV